MGGTLRPVSDPLVSRLSQFIAFEERDLIALRQLTALRNRLRTRVDLVAEGDTPYAAFALLEGMACRYRLMADGRRQILSLILPGDMCDVDAYVMRKVDHSIGTLVPTIVAAIVRNKLFEMLAVHPRINAALHWSAAQDEAMRREHVVSLGRRDARGRIAYFLCELVWRQLGSDFDEDHEIALPLTQIEIADMLGLTPVHVNRVLHDFRRERLIILSHKHLVLLDVDRLQRIAELTPDYLHLEGASSELVRSISRLDAAFVHSNRR
jgi:CRP-like cAMP-binding protein